VPGTPAALAGYTATVTGDRVMRNNTFAYAGYAQADVHVTPQLTVTAGIRYTDEKKTIALVDNRDPRVTPLVNGISQRLTTANLIANGFPTEQRAKLWTPRFAVNYQANDALMVFASATNGFKSGGWVGRATTARAANDFGPEKAWSYEAGLKSAWFDRRLIFNLTAYYIKVSDFQTNASVPVTGGVAFLTDNFADMKNKGIEAELIARPITGLTLNATLGTQDAKFTNPVASIVNQQAACRAQLTAGLVAGIGATSCANGIVSVTGDLAKPVRSPKLTYSLGASYDTPIAALGNARLQPSINASHVSDLETAAANLSLFVDGAGVINTAGRGRFAEGSLSESHWMVNASLGLESEDGNWRLSASCFNCTKAYYTESTISFTYPNAPRTWEVRLKHNF
jgi:iron complex outermembrane receptor protein